MGGDSTSSPTPSASLNGTTQERTGSPPPRVRGAAQWPRLRRERPHCVVYYMCIDKRTRDAREKQAIQAAISHPSGQSDRSIGADFDPVMVSFRTRRFCSDDARQRMNSRVGGCSL